MAQSSELFIRELTHILVKTGALPISEERPLDEAFKKSAHDRYEMFLLEEGLVQPDVLLKAMSLCYKVPSFDAADYFFEYPLLHFFPKDFLLNNGIIPAELDEDILIIVAADPSDPELLAKIGEFVSYDIQFCVGIYQDICDAVEEYYDRALTQDEEVEEQSDSDNEMEAYGFEIEEEDTGVSEDIDEI